MKATSKTIPDTTLMKAVASLIGAVLVLAALSVMSAVKAYDADDAAAADELLMSVLQASKGHDQRGWAYTQVMRIDVEAADEDELVTLTERYDPSKAPGDQRKVIEVREADGTVRTEEDRDTQVDVDLPVYAELFDLADSEFELTGDTPKLAYYRVTSIDGGPLEFGDIEFGDNDLTENVEGEMTITKTGPGAPYVSEMRLHAIEDAGGIFADIDKLEAVFGFTPSEDGQTYLLTKFGLELELDVLIFIDIDIDIDSQIGDYKFVGEYGGDEAP